MRILLTTPYDLHVPGGVNNQLMGIYHALSQDPNDQIKILAPSSAPSPTEDPNIHTMGKITSLPLNGSNARYTLDRSIRPQVESLLESFKPDLIHLQEPFAPLLNHYALHYAPAKKVGTFHTCGKSRWGYFFLKPWLNKVYQQLDLKIAVSQASKDYVSLNFPGEYHIIPNGTDLSAGDKSPLKPLFVDGKINILFVGRMDEPRKGFQFLFEAFQSLEKQTPNQYRLLVVGPGHEEWKAKEALGEIHWFGKVPDQQLNQLYDSCHFLCAPSIGGESFGIILIEAFSFGKPAVIFDIDGYRDVVQDQFNGIVVKNRDASSLATGIQGLMSNSSTYQHLCQQAEQSAEQYHWPNLIQRLKSLYASVL